MYPVSRLWAAIAVNWLVPGSGYFLVGERRRGWGLVMLLNGMFLLGLGLHGSVLWPEFNFRSPTFNIINVLTFSVEMGAGGPALACLAARSGAGEASGSTLVRWLSGDPSHALHDLAVFHLLLVGALNYFACCALHDRFRSRGGPGSAREHS